jgi:hypothetical protein
MAGKKAVAVEKRNDYRNKKGGTKCVGICQCNNNGRCKERCSGDKGHKGPCCCTKHARTVKKKDRR